MVLPQAEILDPPGDAADAGLRPLREDVLAGRYFGHTARPGAAERLADFITAGAGLAAAWFGALAAARLAADPAALRAAADRDIAAIDDMIATQLDAILHHRRMTALEGRWRGLDWMIGTINPSARIKLRLLNATWTEVCRDLDRAAEFDQSQMFRRIYEDEFGMPGGEPYGLMIIDQEVSHRPAAGSDDVSALKSLAAIAAAAFVPMVVPASPALLEVDDFSDLAATARPSAPLRAASHARWRALGSREDMRFVCVTLPRVLARQPWTDDPGRHDGFRYVEYAPDAGARVWMSAAYAFGSCVARAFASFGWPADVRGADTDAEAGGVVLDLPVEPFATDPGDTWTRPSLDLVLTDAQERDLVDAGLMPLNAVPFGTEGVFSAVRSLQNAAVMTTELASANARISAQINSMLCVSRFAHYIKVMGRDMVGAMITSETIQQRLQEWLNGYVNANIAGNRESRSRFPLIRGEVTVTERTGKPGVFGCVIHLQPHFQLDDVSATFRLVTDIAAPGRT